MKSRTQEGGSEDRNGAAKKTEKSKKREKILN